MGALLGVSTVLGVVLLSVAAVLSGPLWIWVACLVSGIGFLLIPVIIHSRRVRRIKNPDSPESK